MLRLIVAVLCAMSSGIFVRNIQNPAFAGCNPSYMKSMPAESASRVRSMRPIVFSAPVRASSTNRGIVSVLLTTRTREVSNVINGAASASGCRSPRQATNPAPRTRKRVRVSMMCRILCPAE